VDQCWGEDHFGKLGITRENLTKYLFEARKSACRGFNSLPSHVIAGKQLTLLLYAPFSDALAGTGPQLTGCRALVRGATSANLASVPTH
jgi:hypothetical protein